MPKAQLMLDGEAVGMELLIIWRSASTNFPPRLAAGQSVQARGS